jgi:2-dehydro-3-deoxy-D-arabinonate dehydratase
VPEDWEAPLAIELTIRDAGGEVLFDGATSTAKMKRTFSELVSWLVRDNPVPPGSVLLTGTGLVPPDDFTLLPGHVVSIHVPEIGTLTNPVVVASDLIDRRTAETKRSPR